MHTTEKYILSLRKGIEDKFDRSFRSATDFDQLELLVKKHSSGSLNASTLKRIWGYTKTTSKPLRSTLTVLANVLGFRDWEAYVERKMAEARIESGFVNRRQLAVSHFHAGMIISLQWNPDRALSLRCVDNDCFEVCDVKNSNLRTGDRMQIDFIREGDPLYCRQVMRQGINLGDYVAGEATGIHHLVIES